MANPNLSEVRQSLPPLPQRQHTKTPTPPKQAGSLRAPKLSNSPTPFARLLNDDPLLHPLPKTPPLVWCGAIMCLVFCLLVIFLGIAIVIIYLVIRPKYPSFDVSNARLNAINFVTPEHINGDLTLLANFTNHNNKISIKYDYLDVKLYLVDRLIAAQVLEPFSQKPREVRLEMIRLISTLVNVPPNPAIVLQRQLQNNRVLYNIRGTFRVRARVGIARFSYMLHARCQVEMTSPPSGTIVSKNCSTER